MKCISVWQPYATLIAIGAKCFETRGWSTPYRGPIAIHAAKSTESLENLADHLKMARWTGGPIAADTYPAYVLAAIRAHYTQPFTIRDFPLGKVLCICELIECWPTAKLTTQLSRQERAFGDFGPDRFGWELKVVELFDQPIAVKGNQGIWDWER